MKRLFFLFAFNTLIISATAQLQPWSLTDMENMAWSPFYKQEKIKKVSVYSSNEYNKIDDANGPDEVRMYDPNGRLITMSRYKYNWAKKAVERLSLDSFFYSASGVVRHRSYDPSGGTLRSEGIFVNNAKGYPLKQEYYYRNNDGVLVKEETTTISYDPKGYFKKLNSVNTSAVLSYSKTFTTDAAGRITKSIKKDGGLFDLIEDYTWRSNGMQERYREFYGKELNKTYKYSYDEKGRRVGKQEEGQVYNVIYTYEGDSKLPIHISTTVEGVNGKGDIRHFHQQLVYEYY